MSTGQTAHNAVSDGRQKTSKLVQELPASTYSKLKVVSVSEAADLSGLSPHFIRDAIIESRLKAFRPGKNKWMIRLKDLESFLQREIDKEQKFISRGKGFDTGNVH
ncbi:MAG: helix-turn-helix domain-containing protein [Candidatus Electryonea clarkiae]|nr:helix-turn-helix domain-containing protein [Candidatus Electryonea clarkiae]